MGIWDTFSDLVEAVTPWSVVEAEAPAEETQEEQPEAETKDDDESSEEPAEEESKDDDDDAEAEDEDEEEEEDDEEEIVDPKEQLEEGPLHTSAERPQSVIAISVTTNCKNSAQCAPAKHHFDECVARVEQQESEGGAKEDCVEEFFHLAHCATGCAAPKLWPKLR
ncbi:hypothetical protein G7046_g5606 [Stylonectria norvegica]|nr:hypothetical protein G7046_g5606 [Stylonectria norvegica]